MTTKKLGGQTAALACPPSLLSFANVVGKKEGEGPLAACFDYVDRKADLVLTGSIGEILGQIQVR